MGLRYPGNSLNPLDLLVLERKRISAIKEKSLTYEVQNSRNTEICVGKERLLIISET